MFGRTFAEWTGQEFLALMHVLSYPHKLLQRNKLLYGLLPGKMDISQKDSANRKTKQNSDHVYFYRTVKVVSVLNIYQGQAT